MPVSHPSWRTEYRELLRLSWPILITQLAHTGMAVTDTVMAGAVSARDLAAVALGASLWVPLFLFTISSLTAVTALIARAWGARDMPQIALMLQQGRWLALLLGLTGSMLLLSAEPLLKWMKVAESIRGDSAAYLHAVAAGLPAAALYQTLRALSEGTGSSKPVMAIALMGFAINIPLNAILIYGWLGLPALGGVGCGYATASIMWINMLAMGWLLQRSRRLPPAVWPNGWGRPLNAPLQRIARLGLPIGAAVFAEASIFAVVTLLIGHMGAVVVASHQIASSFSSVTFMVPLSLGLGLTVRTSQALGAEQPQRARLIVVLGLVMAAGVAVLNTGIMVLAPDSIVAIYSRDDAVQSLAATLLVYAAFYQLADAVQVAAAGSLRGYHDTRATMVITLFAYWGVGLPLGYALGLQDWIVPAMGVRGLWVGLGAGLTMAALLLGWRLYRISTGALSTPDSSGRAAA